MEISFFGTSRHQKKMILLEIIATLPIQQEEKDLYILSMDILDEDDFNVFFLKITKEIGSVSSPKFTFSPL